MATLHETAYPRLKPDPTAKELAEIYTPTEAEMAFVRRITKQPTTQLAVIIHLKMFQRLAYFTQLADVPERIRQHIAKAVRLRGALKTGRLDTYDTSGGKRRHMELLRQFLGVRPLNPAGATWLDTVAISAAETKHVISDIINVLLEELIHHRYELPAFRVLELAAIRAREKVNQGYFQSISRALTPKARTLIDDLLLAKDGSRYTGWQTLKREPGRPTNKEVRTYLQHIRMLQQLADQLPPIDVPVPKLKQFRTMARALDASELAELTEEKRYALATIFIRAQYAKTLDDAAELFIKQVRSLENLAQQKLIAYQLEHSKRADYLIGQLKDVLQAFELEGSDSQRVDAIGGSLRAEVATLLTECDEHMAYAGKNYLPFMLQPYGVVRPLLFNGLELMTLRSTSQDAGMEPLIAAVLSLRNQRRELIEVASVGLDEDKDFDWTSKAWRQHVFGKRANSLGPGWMHRKYFELAVLVQVKDEIKSGDLFIPRSERFDDYREQLVDEATFAQELESYGEVAGLPTDAETFVSGLRSELIALADAVDQRFPENVHADMVDGRLVLRKSQRPEVSSAIATVDKLITERMPATSIVDVLIETAHWLQIPRHFRPFAGTDAQVDDLPRRVITTLFCYGCNLGPTQTARSVKGFSRRQIAWLNLKYVDEGTLERAINDVINTYNKFDLPGYWGSGRSASADGTKWSVYEDNLLSEYHIRYGGYGGIGYYHVSDKYVALFSHFIPCGVYEGIYILDGLMANTSDIQPEIVHGDTQAQSYPVFGLAHLLGIQLMPRIRNIKDLTFFRPEPGRSYKNIQSLFGDSIDWQLIGTHLHDMLRVVVSIRLGKITASSILRRLGTYSRKNKLYFAFRELGKVLRTLFLLRYIDDIETRKTIQAATNKSEEFNGFVKWVFFGGEGVIAENVLHEQRKIVKYSQLVANMVILHNVEGMTRTLAELRKREGIELTPEILAGLSPYRTSHINRFGDYTLDLEKEVVPLNYAGKVLDG